MTSKADENDPDLFYRLSFSECPVSSYFVRRTLRVRRQNKDGMKGKSFQRDGAETSLAILLPLLHAPSRTVLHLVEGHIPTYSPVDSIERVAGMQQNAK